MGGFLVIRTITLGSCVSVQGMFVKQLANGQVVVRDGDRIYAGQPVKAA